MVKWDRERKLKYDFNAIVDFEKVYGQALTDISIATAGFFAIQCLAWAGLNAGIPEGEPKLTLQETGEILQAAFDSKAITMKSIGADFGAALKECGLFQTDGKKAGNAKAGTPK